MTFDTLVNESARVIADTCILHEGNCDKCELKDFCVCEKPIDYKG